VQSVTNDRKTLVLDKVGGGEQFTFDYIAEEAAEQAEIFEQIGKPLVNACLQGYNCSMFAYGQTGSGKTFTIQGLDSETAKGLLPRAFEHLFSEMSKIKARHAHAARFGKTQTHAHSSPSKSLFD